MKPKSSGKILNNVYWALFGKLVNLFSALVVGIMVARYLGPEQYGLMNYVISFVFLFQTVSVFGLDAIEIREESKEGADYQVILGTSFFLRLGLSFICIFASIIVSQVIDANLYVTVLVAIYSSSILFNTSTVIRNYFYALVQNKYVVISEITRTLLSMLIKVILLFLKAPLLWFIIASSFDFLIVASGYYVSYKNQVGSVTQWKFNAKYALFLIKESFPLLLSSAAVIVYQKIDQVMIGQMVDTKSVGYFSVASRIVEILIYIPMVLAQTLQPVLVKAKEEGLAVYQRKAQVFMHLSFWLSLLASCCLSLASYWSVRLLFGKDYLIAVPILQVLAFKAASVALSNTAGTMLIVEGLQKWVILRDLAGCICCVMLNYWLLPLYGALAAAFVAIVSNIVAGYIIDAFIPAYKHIFRQQTETLIWGWKDLKVSTFQKIRQL